jgi:hypothetical protein
MRGTTVASAWLNVLTPVLEILNLDLQFGSGQATSASVLIQSFGWVMRCLAARSGRTAPNYTAVMELKEITIRILTERVNGKCLSRWEMKHFSFEDEMVTLFCFT